MTEFSQLQLGWEVALGAFLVWLLLLWHRRPTENWSYEALTLLLAQMLTGSLFGLLCASRGLPETSLMLAALGWAGGWWLAYWGLRWARCRGDRLILPLSCLLSGMGWVMQLRLDRELALRQICWTLFGLSIMFAISLLLRDVSSLARIKLPLVLSCLALQGGLFLAGEERNGAALWYALGPLSFQPVELVKVLVVCLLALELSSHQGFTRPVLARLGLGWLALEGLLVLQKDLGPALLFFGLFLSMLYVVSGRLSWVLGLLSLSSLGALAAYIGFGHVRVRVEAWLDPLASYQDSGYQLSEALFALAWGGWRGTGLGLGEPWRIPEAATDFIYVAWCEELGSCGGCLLWAALVFFLLRTFHCALTCSGNLERLLALGLASLLSWQTTIVLFGTLRLMPMTGLTLPFISYGGSSLLSNFVVLALLQRMSQRHG